MKHKIISISKAKAKLLELTRRTNEDGEAFLLTKDGEPISALVPLDLYESLLETADVLNDKESIKNLEKALKNEAQGHLWKRDQKGRWVRAGKRKKSA